MALVILSDEEISLLKKKNPDGQKIRDTINQLAGDLGGYGIDVCNLRLNPIMPDEFQSMHDLVEEIKENF